MLQWKTSFACQSHVVTRGCLLLWREGQLQLDTAVLLWCIFTGWEQRNYPFKPNAPKPKLCLSAHTDGNTETDTHKKAHTYNVRTCTVHNTKTAKTTRRLFGYGLTLACRPRLFCLICSQTQRLWWTGNMFLLNEKSCYTVHCRTAIGRRKAFLLAFTSTDSCSTCWRVSCKRWHGPDLKVYCQVVIVKYSYSLSLQGIKLIK